MPSLIPADTINAVRVIKMVCQNIKFSGDEITDENWSGELIAPDEDAAMKI